MMRFYKMVAVLACMAAVVLGAGCAGQGATQSSGVADAPAQSSAHSASSKDAADGKDDAGGVDAGETDADGADAAATEAAATEADAADADAQGSDDANDAQDAGAAASSVSLTEKNADLEFDIIPAECVISVDQLKDMLDTGANFQLVDIRNVRSFATGHVDGARCIPAGQQLELRSNEIQDGTVVLISTKNDQLAATWQTLVDLGHAPESILVVDGGCVAWEKAGYTFTDRQMMGC